METKKKALIAMSGGVDSSVAAALMCERGYECIGATMKLYENEEIGIPRERGCCTLADTEDAREVAYALGMRYYVFNFADAFAKNVIDRFAHAYACGRTPNPCIDCNRYMKFAKLYERAVQLGCDTVATGHYARVRYNGETGRWNLLKSRNAAKDQSYVLCFLTQEQLAMASFPLGDFASKEEVRAIAARYGFSSAAKRDSEDICFVPNGDYAAFLSRYTGITYPEGDFVDEEGHVLGTHRGIVRYTVGQRKGLGLSLPHPMYVSEIRPESNTVVLADADGVYFRALVAEDFNWIACVPPSAPIRVTAKTRYHAREAAATASVLADGTVRVVFDEPQRAVTAGQTVALYDGDIVVGGGVILKGER